MTQQNYDLLFQSEIKHLFPPNEEGLKLAKKHSSDFIIQICGGPRYFDKSRGEPRLIARHSPFQIDKKARIIWLECYKQAMEELDISDEAKKSFWEYIERFSVWMINTPTNKFFTS